MNQKSKLTFGKVFERFAYGSGNYYDGIQSI